MRAAIADTGVEETAPPDPIWGCVGVPAPANAEVHVFARYQTLDGGAIPGVAVAACSGIGGCAVAPDGGRNVLGVTASDGLIEWTTKSTQPGGFKGVLETAATASVDDASAPFLPSLVSVSGAGETNAHSLEKAGPGKPRFPANLITQDQLESFAAAFRDDRVKIKPEYGTLLVTAYDCMQNLVSNAEIKSDNANVDTRTIYFDENGVLDPNLKVTSAFGRAVLVNVPPVSSLTVNLVVGGNKKATQVILGQAGTVTVVFLGPPR